MDCPNVQARGRGAYSKQLIILCDEYFEGSKRYRMRCSWHASTPLFRFLTVVVEIYSKR